MMKVLAILLGLLCLTGTAGAMGSANFDLSWNVIGWGGGLFSSPSYRMESITDQFSGLSTSTNYQLQAGYITVTEPPAAGSLEVKSSPSHVKIYINGVDTGKIAKWTFDDMVPGDYDVYVTLDGYTTSETEHVTVVSDQTTQLHFKLKKIK
jgi:hypothetical protein